MAKVPTEDELNLRRKARRRLIGAVALTLAVVVILPMVLESEPKPSGKDIELRIPSPDKVGAFVPGAAVSEAPDVAQPTTQTPAPVAVIPAPATSVIAIPAPAEKPLAPNAQATPDKAATPQPAEVHKPAEARKTSETKTVDTTASAEGYVAQVGAYTNPNTAKQELKKLKHWGFKAYTEKSGDMIRVRVGPYPDREQAEKVVPLLEKHGLHPVIFSAK